MDEQTENESIGEEIEEQNTEDESSIPVVKSDITLEERKSATDDEPSTSFLEPVESKSQTIISKSDEEEPEDEEVDEEKLEYGSPAELSDQEIGEQTDEENIEQSDEEIDEHTAEEIDEEIEDEYMEEKEDAEEEQYLEEGEYMSDVPTESKEDTEEFEEMEPSEMGDIFSEQYAGLGSLISFASYHTEPEEYVEDEEVTVASSIKEVIDRNAYIQECKILIANHTSLRRKNGYLQKKMSEYYTKRKILSVFDELENSIIIELMPKYHHKMDELYDLQMFAKQNRDALLGEIDYMKSQRNNNKLELNDIFDSLLKREKEVATGLIFTTTGKSLSDKVIDRLIQRQRQKCDVMSNIRLTYIKRRDKVREMATQLQQMENTGGELDIMRYEQLEIEHQNHTDKVEEREEELTRLRDKFSHTIHTLAHVREKLSHVQDEIVFVTDKNHLVIDDLTYYRETVSHWRIQRDKNRTTTEKLMAKSGLLTFKRLLKDMEYHLGELEKEEKLVETLKANNAIFQQKHFAIKKNIQQLQMLQEEEKKAECEFPTARKNKPIIVLPRVR